MPASKKVIVIGIVVVIAILGIGLYAWLERPTKPTAQGVDAANTAANANAATVGDAAALQVPPGTVKINALLPLRNLSGTDVAFTGKVELPQKIVGQYAEEIEIVNFQAKGENAKKSAIKIVWDDGEIDMVPPGTASYRFLPQRRAKQIILIGYSMHERQIFRDSSRPGTLTWEIRYASKDN
ncbi:MAG: hypothetical protein H6Q73_4443 [Firmicutes bacterium]|nr:hypothetical protein [Bacillota bacterium]